MKEDNYTTYYQTGDYGFRTSIPTYKVAEKPKKENPGKKFFLSIFSGLLFGLFACLSFYGGRIALEHFGIIEKPVGNAVANKAIIDQNLASQTVSNHVAVVTTDVTEVVEDVMPSVVSIINTYHYQNYFYSGEAEASGSGILIGSNDDELIIVTNYHVIEGASELTVVFCDEETATAQVKGSDASRDLAVIAVRLSDLKDSTAGAISIATLGDSDALKVGEPVIAIGNSLGYGQSVTTGVVSALNRELSMDNGVSGTFIQTDAAINPGNSGGALLNLSGQVIGINSSKIGGSTVEGMGYAIPISAAEPIIQGLMAKETKYPVAEEKRSYIGVQGASLSSTERARYHYPSGAYIMGVFEDGPAEQAGIREGDFLCEMNGEEIASIEDLQEALKYIEAGTTVRVKVLRYDERRGEYKSLTFSVTLGNRSEMETS